MSFIKKVIFILSATILLFSLNVNSMPQTKTYKATDTTKTISLYMTDEEGLPKLELPVVVIKAGDSVAYYVMTAVFERSGIPYDIALSSVRPAHLESGVGFPTDEPAFYYYYGPDKNKMLGITFFGESYSEMPIGTPFKTIILCMGFVDSNSEYLFNIDQEMVRIKDNLEWAKTKGLTIIGTHLAGEKERNDLWHYNEKIIDLVVPYCDLVVTHESSNYDGKFTEISEEFNIPLIIVNNSLELYPLFQELFKTR